MKKYLKLLFAAIFATLSFTLVSCGDDDDDDNGALVGTWVASYVEDDYNSYTDEITFSKNGNFSITTTEVYYGNTYVYSANGTYTVSGDLKKGAVIIMSGMDNDGDPFMQKIVVVVDGNSMYATNTDGDTVVFTRK
ncbi:MAG: hypothetical protein K2L39_02090 [Muribaculaceae bacterium]|nr:hypothetical protein [Muribaculaceae bacterium]